MKEKNRIHCDHENYPLYHDRAQATKKNPYIQFSMIYNNIFQS